MKRIILVYCFLFSSANFAASFDGWSTTGSVDNSKNTIASAPILSTSTNTQVNSSGLLSITDGSASKTGLKLGVAYGLDVEKVQVTFGLDYSTSKSNNISIKSTAGTVSTTATDQIFRDIKGRTDFYIAPGIRLDNNSVAFIKLGYSTFSYGTVANPSGGVANSGNLGKSGMNYGLGYKQFLDDKSPYYFLVEYMSGKTSNGVINSVFAATQKVDTHNKFTSFNVGVGYNFK